MTIAKWYTRLMIPENGEETRRNKRRDCDFGGFDGGFTHTGSSWGSNRIKKGQIWFPGRRDVSSRHLLGEFSPMCPIPPKCAKPTYHKQCFNSLVVSGKAVFSVEGIKILDGRPGRGSSPSPAEEAYRELVGMGLAALPQNQRTFLVFGLDCQPFGSWTF